jgi:hypothetical protein
MNIKACLQLPDETPLLLKEINAALKQIIDTHQRMLTDLSVSANSSKNIPQLRQKAWDAGIPGSNRDFNIPLSDLNTKAQRVKILADQIIDCTKLLSNMEPEDWTHD